MYVTTNDARTTVTATVTLDRPALHAGAFDLAHLNREALAAIESYANLNALTLGPEVATEVTACSATGLDFITVDPANLPCDTGAVRVTWEAPITGTTVPDAPTTEPADDAVAAAEDRAAIDSAADLAAATDRHTDAVDRIVHARRTITAARRTLARAELDRLRALRDIDTATTTLLAGSAVPA